MHLYGLPQTYKAELSMRPILLASGIYNYSLAKWLKPGLKAEKLEPRAIYQQILQA